MGINIIVCMTLIVTRKHMSPKTMAALTKSPAGPGVRRSSSGSDKLRPVLPFGLDDVGYSGVDDEEGDELGPVPRDGSGNFPSGGGVDEVEYAYGLVHTSFLPSSVVY